MDPSPRGTPRILRIGGKKYAVGLYWQVAANSNDVNAEAVAFAKNPEIDADLIAIRDVNDTRDTAQYAVGRKNDGLAAGSIAGAAVAAEHITGSWLGAFKIPEGGVWIVAVNSDLVGADGDAYYENEAEARDRFDRERHQNWEKIFAPSSWKEPNTREIEIGSLLNQKLDGKKYKLPRLTDINSTKNLLKVILAIGAVAVLAYAGYAWWKDYQASQEVVFVPPPVVIPPPVVVTVTPPWHTQPVHAPWFEQCRTVLASLPTNIPGYQPEGMSCDATSAAVSFKRLPSGFLGWAETYLEDKLPEGARLVSTPDQLTLNIRKNLPLRPARGTEAIQTEGKLRSALIEHGQATNDTIQIAEKRIDPPPLPPPPAGNNFRPENLPPPPWAAVPISVTTQLPERWGALFSSIPGFIPIRYAASPDGRWTIQGEFYVRN